MGQSKLRLIGERRGLSSPRRANWIVRLASCPNAHGWSGRSTRVILLIALTVIPFWGIYRQIGVSIAGGSPFAYLCVIPVLAAMMAFGYRAPPRGIGDPESDLILAAVFGGLGLFLRHLMSHRFPTLSGLWQLPLVGAVLWAACLAAVLFGVRRVMQAWPLWTLIAATVTPLPFLLSAAAAGGGVMGSTAITGAIGGVAVAIACASRPLLRRLGAAAASAGLSAGVGYVVVAAGLDRSPHSGLFIALLVGAVIPVAVFVAVQGRATGPEPATTSTLPERSALSLVALCVGGALVFALNLPFSSAQPAPPRADAHWTTRMNLSASQSFSFITRYLGQHATFRRYAVASRPGFPEAAVDVVTSDNLAALQTYRDAIWYPATVPPNYHSLDLGNPAIVDGRATATDSSLATNGHALDWYLLTWLWQTGTSYQQVFVVVNQTWTSQDPPPVPAELSLRANVIGPALWLARQQADPSTIVDPLVIARALQVAGNVIGAGEPWNG